MFLGPRTTVFPAPDLAAGRAWFARVLGTEPYFDEPFYVGFSVAGFELGLDPAASVEAGAVTYWGVRDCDAALAALLDAGATPREEVRDVGEGIRLATVLEPAGSVLGIIENPHFVPGEPPAAAGQGLGPGR